eukprot:m.208083 g.208083  ORF g.208083 m.208083 type:complete len:523 (+) comp15806_c0_seq28:3090-4658(+)
MEDEHHEQLLQEAETLVNDSNVVHPVNGSPSDTNPLVDNDNDSDIIGDAVPTKNKTIGLTGGISVIAGCMIGSGIFASPGPVLLHTSSISGALAAWTIAGVIALLGAVSYAELGTLLPVSGGEYKYVLYVFGKPAAFVYIWSTALVTKPGSLAIICLVCAEYILKPFYLKSEPPWLLSKGLSVMVILTISTINSLSARLSIRMQNVLTAFKTVALVGIGFWGFIVLIRDVSRPGTPCYDNFRGAYNTTETTVSDFGIAVVAGLWSYDGWNNLNLVTAELVNPVRNLPRAVFMGVPLVTFCYVLANLGYFSVLRLTQIADWEKDEAIPGFVTTFGKVAFGDFGTVVFPLCIALSTFGAANGSAFSGGRLVYEAALRGDLPTFFSKEKSVGNDPPIPIRGLLLQAALASLMVLPGNFEQLLAGFSAVAWIFYFQAVSCLLILRYKEPKKPRPFRVWIWVPILFCIIAFCLVISTLLEQPVESAIAIALVLSGIPVYMIVKWVRKRNGYTPEPIVETEMKPWRED